MPKVAGLLENANDFLEAAKRCGWERFEKKGVATMENAPLLIPEKVNMAFACELYLKAIAENKKISVKKVHDLDEIFLKLPKIVQKEIYDIWRIDCCKGTADCDYLIKMFFDNLEATAKVFIRFRYANEWAGSMVSLQHSFTLSQFEKFSSCSLKRPLGASPIYDGFLEQFALSLKTYAEKLIGKTYNS